MHLDFAKQKLLFDPATSGIKKVVIYGIGSVGSHAAENLAKAGFQQIEIWDYDKVEGDNLAAQAYWEKHIGMLKVDALKEILETTANVTPIIHNEKITKDTVLMFEPQTLYWCGIDDSRARKIVWDKLKIYPNVMFVDTRIGQFNMCYRFIDTSDKDWVEDFEKILGPDRPHVDLECGEKCCNPVNNGLVALAIGNIFNIIMGNDYFKFFFHNLLVSQPTFVKADKKFELL